MQVCDDAFTQRVLAVDRITVSELRGIGPQAATRRPSRLDRYDDAAPVVLCVVPDNEPGLFTTYALINGDPPSPVWTTNSPGIVFPA